MTCNSQLKTRQTTHNASSQLKTICITMSRIIGFSDYLVPDYLVARFPKDCDIDCVSNKARKQKIEIALNNSCAFGVNNACLVLRKV